MNPEEVAAAAAAAAERYESDTAFLRSAGAALEAESRQRRESNQPPMTPADAAAIVAAL